MKLIAIIATFLSLQVLVLAVSKDQARKELNQLITETTSVISNATSRLGKDASGLQDLATEVSSVGAQQVAAEKTRLLEQLVLIENSAQAEHVNATSCTASKRGVLTELSDLAGVGLFTCSNRFLDQGITEIHKGISNLNVIVNDVYAVERRLEACEATSAICLDAVYEIIKFQEDDIPRRVTEDIQFAESKAEANKLYLSTCGVRATEVLLGEGSYLIAETNKCVDELIKDSTKKPNL